MNTYIYHIHLNCIQCYWTIFLILFHLFTYFSNLTSKKELHARWNLTQQCIQLESNMNSMVKQLFSNDVIISIRPHLCHRQSFGFGFHSSCLIGCFSWHHYYIYTPFHIIWFVSIGLTHFIHKKCVNYTRNHIPALHQWLQHCVGFSYCNFILSMVYIIWSITRVSKWAESSHSFEGCHLTKVASILLNFSTAHHLYIYSDDFCE